MAKQKIIKILARNKWTGLFFGLSGTVILVFSFKEIVDFFYLEFKNTPVVRSLPEEDFELKMKDKFSTYQKSEGF